MQPRAIFFDLDDTLLDGWSAMTVAWETVCHDYGHRLGCDPEELRQAIRREATAFWRDEEAVGHWRVKLDEARAYVVSMALAGLNADTSLAPEIALAYARRHREHLAPFDDAFATLEAIRSAGLKVGLITNGDGAMQRAKIERFAIAPRMDVIVVEGEFGKGKPQREVFEHAATAVEVAPCEAWHVGDNLYADIRGAKDSGLHAVWIHRGRLELRADLGVVPDRAIGNLGELREALGI